MPPKNAKTNQKPINSKKVENTKSKVKKITATENPKPIKKEESTAEPEIIKKVASPTKIDEQLKQNDQPPEEPEHAKKRTYSEYGNLVQFEFSDHWDENLIPQELIDEIYAELGPDLSMYENSSSYELFDHVTESGRIIKMYRRKQKEIHDDDKDYITVLKRISAVEDIGGGIVKSQLERYTRQQLKDMTSDLKFQLEYNKAENFILENTVLSLEKRDMEIEKALPVFKFTMGSNREGNKTIAKITDDVCDEELSSDEENTTGQYIPFIPATDIDSKDDYFDDLSEKSKLVLQEYLRSLGEVAPSNYDAIFHRYGDLVRPTEEDLLQQQANRAKDKETRFSIGGGAPKFIDTKELKEDEGKPPASENPSTDILMEKPLIDFRNFVIKPDEQDPDFPDFIQRLAKPLPIDERLKYGLKEEEIFRAKFEKIENQEILKANRVIVYTDTYMRSFKLLKRISEILQRTIKNGYHPLTRKLKAEDIIRFRRRMRNMILAEETKFTMIINEFRKRKQKVDKQVKDNKDLGESIQAIDYEQLRISNLQYQHKIDEQHDMLKQLKIITASQFEKLKNLKLRVHKKVIHHKHIVNDIDLRRSLQQNFDRTYEKYHSTYATIRDHNLFLQKRLRQFRAPSTMDYMNYQKMAKKLQKEVIKLKGKIKGVQPILQAARVNLESLETKFPAANIKKLNEDWLRHIKREVVKKKLAYKFMTDLLNPIGGSMGDFVGKRVDKKEYFKEERSRPKVFSFRPSRKIESGTGDDGPPRILMTTNLNNRTTDGNENVDNIQREQEESLLKESQAVVAKVRKSIIQANLANPGHRKSLTENDQVPHRKSGIHNNRLRESLIENIPENRKSIVTENFDNRKSLIGNPAEHRKTSNDAPANRKSVMEKSSQRKTTTMNPNINNKVMEDGKRNSVEQNDVTGNKNRKSNAEYNPAAHRKSVQQAIPAPTTAKRRGTLAQVKTRRSEELRNAKQTLVQKY